ncbi:MAG: hypothetical protein PVJ67_05860 [Candidatus Pacearchaeota archaeon]|jgi:hypothetical protein
MKENSEKRLEDYALKPRQKPLIYDLPENQQEAFARVLEKGLLRSSRDYKD